jgi:hypothetical protein
MMSLIVCVCRFRIADNVLLLGDVAESEEEGFEPAELLVRKNAIASSYL